MPKKTPPQLHVLRPPMHTPSKVGFRLAKLCVGGARMRRSHASAHACGLYRICVYTWKRRMALPLSKSALCSAPSRRSAVRRPIPYATKRDPFNHPAWTGNTGVITETESLRAFRERFGEYGFAPKMEVAAKGAPPTAVGDATAPKEM